MKKKIKKQAHTSTKTQTPMFSSMRIIIVGTSVVALLVAFVFINKTTVKQSVQGVSIVKGMYNEGMVSWRPVAGSDRKSTRLNSSHQIISYAVFCLKKKRKK